MKSDAAQLSNYTRVLAPRSEHLDWGWALAPTIQLVADPRAFVGVPACPMVRPPHDERVFSTALGYWTALDHLLRYQLGWTNLAGGLARWQDEGAEPLCPTLAVIREIWLGDGFLDCYLAWRLEKSTDRVPDRWQKQLRKVRYEHGKPGRPYGPWALHLEDFGGHVGEPADSGWPEQFLVSVDVEANFANGDWQPDVVLVFDDPRGLECGWYGYLSETAHHFDSVDVYFKRHGHCGQYRRSPATGRWHTAPEEIHQWGC